MRKKTITGLSFLLSLAFVYGLTMLARSQGVRLPFTGFVTHIIASLILAPAVVVLLTRLNRPLVEWRKKRGRDIAAEERHEIGESDFISLRPRQSDDVQR